MQDFTIYKLYIFRLSQVGVVSYGSECPSLGVYSRVTKVKYWIQFLTQGAADSNCNQDVPMHQGNNIMIYIGNGAISIQNNNLLQDC